MKSTSIRVTRQARDVLTEYRNEVSAGSLSEAIVKLDKERKYLKDILRDAARKIPA